jgi:anti-anti-sigma factor
MQITVTEFGGRAVRVALAGDLDIPGAEKLDLPLAALAGSGGGLVVDLTQLDRIASIGIRHLVLAARTLGRGRGQLLLLGPNEQVTNALMMACVDGLLSIVWSEDEARAALDSRVGGPAACLTACAVGIEP